MALEYLDSLNLAGDVGKPNEDALVFDRKAAMVLDGATSLGDPFLQGASDAAWIARTGGERVLAHLLAGESPAEAVRIALHDVTEAFARLRRRVPTETWELPFASMMLAVPVEGLLSLLWFGDCDAIVCKPGGDAVMVGDAVSRRARERIRVAALAGGEHARPAAAGVRDTFLDSLRQARNTVNTERGGWLFGPDQRAADHAAKREVETPAGTRVLLMTDGFLALVSDYERYDVPSLLAAAESKGLAALGQELREIERNDADGARYPRFKTHDDATALLFRVV